MQTKYITSIVVLLVVISVGYFYFAKKLPGQTTKIEQNSTVYLSNTEAVALLESTSTEVLIFNSSFFPSTITVKKGTEITWINGDSMPHTVTSKNGGFDSGTISKGDKFTHTFDSVGTYDYVCNFHPSMKANVVVTE